MTPQPRLGMLEPTTSERTNVPYRRIRHIVAFAAVVAWLTSGCTNAADKQSKDAPKNVGVSISGKGTYPPDFLAKVPKPELALETAIGTAGTFRLRFTSSSATSDLAAYKNLLVTACYTMSNETKDLAGPSKRATLLATKDAISIVVSAFGPVPPAAATTWPVVVNPVVNLIPNSINGATTTSGEVCAS